MKLRTSNKSDAQRIYEIWYASVEATHDFLQKDDFQEISKQVVGYANSASFLLAEDETGTIIGFMGMTGNNIDSLFIHPTSFGKGVGTFLISSVKKDFPSLTVEVNEQNSGAKAFYEKMGFQFVKRSPVDGDGRPYPILKYELR